MSENAAYTTNEARLSLVLGVDGSGKSTFLNGLREKLGFIILEPTNTEEAKTFKADHVGTPVDIPLVETRETIFLRLNNQFDALVTTELEAENNIATTGNSLVTLVSHGLMRAVVGVNNNRVVDNALERWVASNPLMPDEITLIYAPSEVIRSRIQERQLAGDQAERFWGFNSPHFLSLYQETWLEVIETLPDYSPVPCMTLDSSQLSPETMIGRYREVFSG